MHGENPSIAVLKLWCAKNELFTIFGTNDTLRRYGNS